MAYTEVQVPGAYARPVVAWLAPALLGKASPGKAARGAAWVWDGEWHTSGFESRPSTLAAGLGRAWLAPAVHGQARLGAACFGGAWQGMGTTSGWMVVCGVRFPATRARRCEVWRVPAGLVMALPDRAWRSAAPHGKEHTTARLAGVGVRALDVHARRGAAGYGAACRGIAPRGRTWHSLIRAAFGCARRGRAWAPKPLQRSGGLMPLPWVRLDTAMPDNPKVIDLVDGHKEGRAAAFVWLCSLAYSGKHGTDGFIPKGALSRINGRPVDARLLVEAGLWRDEMGSGWSIPGWTEFQESNEETQKRSERARNAAFKRWGKEAPP